MDFKNSSLLCLALFLACSSAIRAFDITQLLGQYPEFSTFNKYLTETKLADQINSRNTITVLAVEDSAMHSIAAKSPEAIKAIIGTHVILDFFDEKKLMEAQASSQQLTTLFQASGLAVNQQGFLKVALVGEGEIAFGSAASDAPADATELVRTVTSEPYNISILQVTKPILAPGVDSPTPASSSGAQPSQGDKAPIAAQSAKAPVTAQEAKLLCHHHKVSMRRHPFRHRLQSLLCQLRVPRHQLLWRMRPRLHLLVKALPSLQRLLLKPQQQAQLGLRLQVPWLMMLLRQMLLLAVLRPRRWVWLGQ